MIGLLLLKHIYGLSDEGACERRVCDHYFQCFTYEEFFQHQFPYERSAPSNWQKRLGSKLCWLSACAWRTKPAPCVTAIFNGERWILQKYGCTSSLHPFRWHRDDAIELRKIKRGDLIVMISSWLAGTKPRQRFV